MEEQSKSIYKAFLTFSSILLIVGLGIWFYSPISRLQWGSWQIPKFQNVFPFVVLSLGILAIYVFQREVKLAKSQQQNKDYQIIINFLEVRIKQLTKELGIAEERTKALLLKLKKLTLIPDLALFLMEKVLNTLKQYEVDLNIQITGNLDSLKDVQAEDLKQSIEMMLVPIQNNLNSTNENQRGDVNLFIIEKDNNIRFQIMHDYIGDQINTEILEWNMKKVLHKNGGSLKVEHDQEDELNTLILSLDIPKVSKAKSTKTA